VDFVVLDVLLIGNVVEVFVGILIGVFLIVVGVDIDALLVNSASMVCVVMGWDLLHFFLSYQSKNNLSRHKYHTFHLIIIPHHQMHGRRNFNREFV
jgi:hypothetical protein